MKNNNRIFISIGSNLKGHMNSSKEIMNSSLCYLNSRGLKVIKKSNIYKSRPWPSGHGPYFYNRVVVIESKISAFKILCILKAIEITFGRKLRKYKNSPRVLDLDIIDCRNEVVKSNLLTIPHPRLNVRDFILKPLQELDTNWVHPINNKNIKSLLVNNNRYSINKATLV